MTDGHATAPVTGATSSYLLGHAGPEVDRLLLQARLYGDQTEHALRLAGLKPGMRVLDVGCGPGDVSFAAARLVGPTGSVIGVDSEPAIVELARVRAADLGLSTVSFEKATIPEIPLEERVDAVIGRLILMHLPDPVAALRELAGLVRPGGLVLFQEFEISSVRSAPELPTFSRLADLITRSFRGVGLSTDLGSTLYPLFRRAGLPSPRLNLGAPLGGADEDDVLAYPVAVWRLMFPAAEQLGLGTRDMSDFDDLLRRMRAEALRAEAVAIMPALISAWSRIPA